MRCRILLTSFDIDRVRVLQKLIDSDDKRQIRVTDDPAVTLSFCRGEDHLLRDDDFQVFIRIGLGIDKRDLDRANILRPGNSVAFLDRHLSFNVLNVDKNFIEHHQGDARMDQDDAATLFEQQQESGKQNESWSLTLDELTEWMRDQGKAESRALQVYKALWQRAETDFGSIQTISKPVRQHLADHSHITWLEQSARLESEDGSRKYLWRCTDGSTNESVLIPDEARPGLSSPRRTLCVSTQVGCAMACSFCLTGDLGLKRNLTPAEIANQPLQVQRDLGPDQPITNIVLMGMGEPLHNYANLVIALKNMLHVNGQDFSHRRITVSTVGLVPALRRLASELPVNIAISLNATTEEQRRQVMPITKRYSMTELMQVCRELPLPSGKRITFEYVMMDGFNSEMADAERLVDLMSDVPAKVNLIPYNENPNRDIQRPSDQRVKDFQHHLVSNGVNCSVRVTRGRDISAACGQLGKATERMASRLG